MLDTEIRDKMKMREITPGIELLQAWFAGPAYSRHCHESYAIGITDSGVQSFDYRGTREDSTVNRVMVLHPDEMHNGRAGTDLGFGYRMLYVNPALIAEALRTVRPGMSELPFVTQSVSDNFVLKNAVHLAWKLSNNELDLLAVDEIIMTLCQGLVGQQHHDYEAHNRVVVDWLALQRVRDFLDATVQRQVFSSELEVVSGFSRFALARQFKLAYGTSPYRYSLRRRLVRGQQLIAQGAPLIDAGFSTGFSDQAHFSRIFKSGYGLTPGQYRKLERAAGLNTQGIQGV
ncbi:MAG: AraC-like DNA-binding protein [Oceanospirillaceae bacterium]|jgi:AraC-like DNA-binding protein